MFDTVIGKLSVDYIINFFLNFLMELQPFEDC